MNKSRRGFSVAWALGGAVLLALGPIETGAQDNNAACTLRGRDSVLSTGVTVKACLDVNALNNQTVVIPKNVTRIDSSGFSLCETSETRGGLADIVYVMDESGSMALRYAWVSPDGRDTVYLNGTNCNPGYTSTDLNNFGTMTVQNQGGTRQVNKINPAKDPRTRCTDYWSGDPFSQRAIAFRGAIDFQAQRAPDSRAGYLGFAGALHGSVTPRQINTPANIAAVKEPIDIRNEDATNYTVALTQAKQWLNNPALSPNQTKAIIFLSDGKPTRPQGDSLAYLRLLDSAMAPVYGIFLGVPRADTLLLSDVSRLTGGQFFLIPPNRPDSLRTIVERILNIIFRQYQPNESRITNSTIIPNATAYAGAGAFTRQDANSWLINFDKPVGLNKETNNAIRLTTRMREVTSGDTVGRLANFQLSTTGLEERINRNLPGTQFSIRCHDLPPDINPVKVAYIKDENGDGSGDKVFFEFTRPLLAMPASIDTVYWNRVAPGFQNKVAPVLTFLPGSNQTIVIADFTASPFGKGLTGIPDGEIPVGVLPPGGVFQSQRPPIKDSIGPIIDSGLARPYDNSKGSAASVNLDTLVVHMSEPLATSTNWNGMIYWGKPVNGECKDFDNAKKLVPAREPTPSADQKTFTIVINAGQAGGSPVVGDCIYLSRDGDVTDMRENIPSKYGIPLRGRLPPRVIELFRGYPPVVGLSADQPGFLVMNNDPRKGDNLDYSKPNQAGTYVTYWIPPVVYPADPTRPPITDVNQPSVGNDISVAVEIPKNISTVQVVSTGKYLVDVVIFDLYGHFVKSFSQDFGYRGELNNGARVVSKGLVSYLVWDLKDSKGQRAGQGVYIWKALFRFDTGKQEIQYTRTGVMRPLLP